MTHAFTIKEALSYGWKKLSDHFWFLALLTLAFVAVGSLLDHAGTVPGSGILSQIMNIILGYFAMFTFVRVGLMIHRGHQKFTWNDIFDFDLGLFGMYAAGAILFTIAYMIGFLLLVIPGLIVLVRVGLFAFVLVDEKLMPFQAMKKSLHMTRGRFWHLFGFSIILALINLLGALAFGIGIIITAPFCLLATVYVYERLKEHHAHAHAAAPAEHHHAPQS